MPIIARAEPSIESEYPTDVLEHFARRLRDCLGMDLLEEDTAQVVMMVHAELNTDHDLFRAVWGTLKSNERSALNKYIRLAAELQKPQPPTGKLL